MKEHRKDRKEVENACKDLDKIIEDAGIRQSDGESVDKLRDILLKFRDDGS